MRTTQREVLDYIFGLPIDAKFTTKEIADGMCRQESAVRVAISWLVKSGRVRPFGTVIRALPKRRQYTEYYAATTYVMNPIQPDQKSQQDVYALLNTVLCARNEVV